MFFEIKFWCTVNEFRVPIGFFPFCHPNDIEGIVCFMSDNFPGCNHSIIPIESVGYEVYTNEAIERRVHIL